MWFIKKIPNYSLIRQFLDWFPLAAGLTLMSLFVYVAVQQNYRQSLNDPQIQMAEDGAEMLAAGATPESVLPTAKVDIAKSLAIFVSVFDKSNSVLASNATLDGGIPVPPPGVINTARNTGQNRISWQPRPGVRSATVSVAVKDGTGRVVMVGRSMREVESRIDQFSLLILGVWGIALMGTLVVKVAVSFLV